MTSSYSILAHIKNSIGRYIAIVMYIYKLLHRYINYYGVIIKKENIKMKQNNENKNEQRDKPVVYLSLDKALIEQLDEERKTIPMSTFVNYLLHEHFDDQI